MYPVPIAGEGRSSVHVVLFSGGRGSGALTRQLVSNPGVELTIAINGYDDGASTGEVRRFLADSLGPSDFRKNASTVARELHTAAPGMVELLDRRLPADVEPSLVPGLLDEAAREGGAAVAARLARFRTEALSVSPPFDYRDCALGNLVFAGSFLLMDRDFNRAVDDYSALLGLPTGLIENVTDGADAHLVATAIDGRFLPDEESIVAAEPSSAIEDIFLLAPPLSPDEVKACADPSSRRQILAAHSVTPALNERLRARIAAADLVVYAPGTQHSSLFPSYLTGGLAEVIAGNLRAIKLLVTNIEPDAEITGSSAVDIVDRALYYLRRKDSLRLPTPALITHYLLNDPGQRDLERPYIPLGQLDTLEDPRLIRIGNYEDGVTGRHDASRVLGPFVESVLKRGVRKRVAIFLHDAGSPNKVAQTLLELVRGGLDGVPIDVTLCYEGAPALDDGFTRSLPFPIRALPGGAAEFQRLLAAEAYDYGLLFESSGMYRGEDLVGVLSQLASGRLDAVWGSRRLSTRDIEASYAIRYRKSVVLGAISYAGSHVLSLAYLALFGRYISDTLSGVRAVRTEDLTAPEVDLAGRDANHQLLARLLRRKADVLEVPVQFLPLSPERVKRTTMADGMRALGTIVRSRLGSAE